MGKAIGQRDAVSSACVFNGTLMRWVRPPQRCRPLGIGAREG